MQLMSDGTLHPPSCRCRPCRELHVLAHTHGVTLNSVTFPPVPKEQQVTVYQIEPPLERPEPPGDSTLREVRSDRVKQYVKDAAAYIEVLEIATCGHVHLVSCKLCGKPRPVNYICPHCCKDDSTLQFG